MIVNRSANRGGLIFKLSYPVLRSFVSIIYSLYRFGGYIKLELQYKSVDRYLVYEDGSVYSTISNKFLKPDIDKYGYYSYILYINGNQIHAKAHRLVAYLFLGLPNMDDDDIKYQVNHIDGNKANNHYSNLEWCTAEENNRHAREMKINNVSESNSRRWNDPEFRERTSKNISAGIIAKGSQKGKNNSRFRYEIYDAAGNEYDRHSIMQVCNIAQSTADTWIKRAADGITVPGFEEKGIYVIDTKR
jgi:hypothetical protein